MQYAKRSVLAFLGILVFFVPARGQEPVMVAHYVDVGQGLSVLLEFPCGAVLIDTGAQDMEHVEYLAGYLRDFFARRGDLNNTLNTVLITHPHIDHTRGIRAITEVCRVRNYVDNGVTQGSGGAQVRWMRDNAENLSVRVRPVDNDEVTALPHKNGLTDGAIDDVQCPRCDPKIAVLSGGRSTNPGWTQAEYQNWNNHSLVIRVDFGQSSFLFTGDLESVAIENLLHYYENTQSLRANVYQVGHHGSANGTTRELVQAMSPSIAVIGVGKWDFGQQESNPFTTYRYGHPRRAVIDLLSEFIPEDRSSPLATKVFEGSQAPVDFTVRKRIYATGWDGDVKVSAKLDGTFAITTAREDPQNAPRNLHVARLRQRGSLSPDKRSADERAVAFDSVMPDSHVTQAIPLCPQVVTYRANCWAVAPPRWQCPPRRGFLFRRQCGCR